MFGLLGFLRNGQDEVGGEEGFSTQLRSKPWLVGNCHSKELIREKMLIHHALSSSMGERADPASRTSHIASPILSFLIHQKLVSYYTQ